MAAITKYLRVFEGLNIPVDYAPIQKYVTLGASDSGKTFMLARFAEQCAKAGIFFVILDPVGKHWSLRAGLDGSPKGGIDDVYVIGGLHGDVPLDPKSGELIADVVVDHPGRYVLDVSTFETDQDVYNFAAAFAKRIFRRKMKDPGWPMLLMLEESETFLPQVPQAGQQIMKGAFGRIVRQGRNHGLGVFLVFQRSAAGDKGAISQCKILIVKRASHKRDRKAVDDWVESNGTQEQRDELMSAMASLRVDEAYVWDPTDFLDVFQRTKVLPRETFDSSANAKHGERLTKVELVPLDVAALGKKMSEVAQKAASDDPKKLHKTIAELTRKLEQADKQLQERPENVVRETETVYEQVEVPTLNEGEIESLEKSLTDLTALSESLHADATEVAGNVALLQNALDAAKEMRGEVSAKVALPPSPPRRPLPLPASPSGAAPASAVTEDGAAVADVESGALKLAEVLVKRYPMKMTQTQLATMAGRSRRSSSFRPHVRQIVVAGLASEDGKMLQATQTALDLFPNVVPMSSDDVLQMWMTSLPAGPARMLKGLVEDGPVYSREELAAVAGMSPTSSGVGSALKTLRDNGLVYGDGSAIAVADFLT